MNEYMKLSIDEANIGIKNNEGGPFGAVIVDKEGNVIASSHNKVILNNDPTAHAEVETIREACKKLGTYDLSEYILYTSCEPCPMCLSAIIWSNIKEVYYGCTKKDASDIGFRDDLIYKYLEGNFKDKEKILKINNIDREKAIKLFEEYKNKGKIIY